MKVQCTLKYYSIKWDNNITSAISIVFDIVSQWQFKINVGKVGNLLKLKTTLDFNPKRVTKTHQNKWHRIQFLQTQLV